MTIRKGNDSDFDDYRRQRLRVQAKVGLDTPSTGYESQAMRELEQVEQREVRDERLTREVHDFFAAATRQAAAIVDKVARDAEQAAGQRVEQEMEAFLIDSLARMNNFVITVLNTRRGQVAETRMEPRVGNLLGSSLDQFRHAGTAETGDKHIGKNPFAVPLDDVQREFREAMAANDGPLVAAVPIDTQLTGEGDPTPSVTAAPSAPVRATAPVQPPAPNPTPPPSQTAEHDLEQFKSALKALVRQGVMSRDEARAAWQTRLQALGAAS